MRLIPITDTDPETLGQSVGHHLLRRPVEDRSRFVAALLSTGGIARALWRHVTRGSAYEEIFRGTLQLSGTTHDMSPVIIYRSVVDGSIWVRKVSEFMDGRFEEVK